VLAESIDEKVTLLALAGFSSRIGWKRGAVFSIGFKYWDCNNRDEPGS